MEDTRCLLLVHFEHRLNRFRPKVSHVGNYSLLETGEQNPLGREREREREYISYIAEANH